MDSLHAEALRAAGVTDSCAMSDRDLAILLLVSLTDPVARLTTRSGHLVGHVLYGSTVRAALLRAAGLDPDEVTGWEPDPDGDECPVCGATIDPDEDEVSHG